MDNNRLGAVCAICVVAFAVGITASAAVVPTQDGSDYILSLNSGSDTCSTVLTGSGTLYKRGAGEVVLDTASTGFSGSVVVEEGTLTIAHVSAAGATSNGNSTLPITVESGATLHLKLPGATKFGHHITIAGKGVNNAGAFKYTRSNSSDNSDSLINKLILSADATIDVSTRWGMADNKIIELNGHTLTRIGTANWMVYNHIQSTGAPGEVNNVYGTLTFQGSPDIDENVTIVVTNVSSTSVLGLWGASSVGTIKGPIKLYSGRSIEAQSGTAKTSNNLGPLQIVGPSGGSVKLLLERGSPAAARTMSIDGPVTSDSGMKTSIEGIGSIWFNNDVSLSGNTTFACGNAYLCGAESKRDIKLVMNKSTTVTHEAGKTYVRMLRVANGGSVAAQLRQTGGVMGSSSDDNGHIGESSGSRGFFTLEGGEMHFSNDVYVAKYAGSYGAIRQTGGLLEMRRSGGNDKFFCAGRGGTALFVQTGGTNDTLVAANTQVSGFQMATNEMCEATISGVGTLFRTGRLAIGADGGVYTNVLNINDGAVVRANRLRKVPTAAAASKAYVNVNGGTLMPTFAWNWSVNVNSHPDHFVVWENGITVDTSENALGGGAGGSSFSFALEKPTGKGVESVTLPDLTGKTYIGVARVVFEDATGWGASAYAEYDFTSKTLTHVVITSRGCNYSDNAKAYVESPARTTRYECALTLSDNGGSGMFVKRGAPDLEIGSTDSTIDGGYAVEGGALKLGVVPGVAVPVRVESGATLNLNNKGALTASTFEGAGSVINGDVTVTGVVRAKCAEIFAGGAAAFSGDLTLAEGAVFEIMDAENLANYKDAGRAVALTAGGAISRQPALSFATTAGTAWTGDASMWGLRLSADGKTLSLGCRRPFLLIVR